jgi:hypothetical protein
LTSNPRARNAGIITADRAAASVSAGGHGLNHATRVT